MEIAREYLGVLLGALSKEKQDGIGYLNLVQHIARKEHNEDLLETTEATIDAKQKEIEMLEIRKGRAA